MIDLRTSGLAELQQRLRNLPERVARRALPKVIRAGAVVARREFRRAAPVRASGGLKSLGGSGRAAVRAPGYLKRRGVILKRQKGSTARFQVGPSRSAFYGNIVEVGQSGRVAARPWLEPAWRRAQNQALAAIERAARKFIEQELARGGRRRG